MWETWVRSPSWEDPLEKGGYPLQYSCLESSMDCIVHGVTESDMTSLFTSTDMRKLRDRELVTLELKVISTFVLMESICLPYSKVSDSQEIKERKQNEVECKWCHFLHKYLKWQNIQTSCISVKQLARPHPVGAPLSANPSCLGEVTGLVWGAHAHCWGWMTVSKLAQAH